MKTKPFIVVMCGVSGTGKSTLAHIIRNKIPKTLIISRDKLRELLYGFDGSNVEHYYSCSFNQLSSKEKIVSKYQDELIRSTLSRGYNVIIDNTNLSKYYLSSYKIYNTDVFVVSINTEYKDLIDNINDRNRKVNSDIINNQIEKYNELKPYLYSLPTIKYNDIYNAIMESYNEFYKTCKNKDEYTYTINTLHQYEEKVNLYNYNLKSCIVVDIDGTIAHANNRSPYNYNEVGTDDIDTTMWFILKKLSENYKIVYCSGRDSVCREDTLKWLKKHNFVLDNDDDLYMRSIGDNRSDYIIKEELWKEIEKNYNIDFMFDDRLQVINHARHLGYKVLDVAGNYF